MWPSGRDVKEFCVARELRPLRRAERRVAVRSFLLAALLLIALAFPRAQAASAVKGEVSAAVENGFARLIFTLAEDVESQVRVANGILIITFKRPVDITVDSSTPARRATSAPRAAIPTARRIRIALARKVTMNSMAAGERLFVDLLPDTWTGLPPGLPREVIEELARRAREAEKKVRQQRTLARQTQAWRRSGCGSPASRPSRATSSTCPSSSASPPTTARTSSRSPSMRCSSSIWRTPRRRCRRWSPRSTASSSRTR